MSSSVDRLPFASAAQVEARAEPASAPSFDEIYDAYFDFVWTNAGRLGVSEAAIDDVVQDVFLVLHRRLADYDGRASMKSWLYGILARTVRDHRRTFRRKQARCVPHAPDSSEDVGLPSPDPSPSDLAERLEKVALLNALLEELDEDKREVLVLAELEQMTVPEIAECLGANVNTVYSRLRAAKRAFEEAYARHCARHEGRTR
jgi:RNA polymerase sigma-70 factor (ECF subfamily)